MSVDAYPLCWPQGWERVRYRYRARFGVSFARARDDLLHQIRLMGGRHAVLSTNVSLRQDGLPYANQAEPSDPGVAVYFTVRRKGEARQVCFACDRWDRVRDNVRAIGRSIEAIRSIERWAASDMMDRAFTGFTALPPPGERHWMEVLGFPPGSVVTWPEVRARYRSLAQNAHPDLGGSEEQMVELNVARDAAKEALHV